MISTEQLSIYLNDHLAGSVAGLSLARRIVVNNRDNAYGRAVAPIADEIETDKRTLETMMRLLEIRRDPLKPIGAWVAERLGRLKPNGRSRGYSPLSRLEELELLTLGVTGKLLLWRALRETSTYEDRLRADDLDALAARADSQRIRLETLRLEAAREMLFDAEGASPRAET